MTPTRKIIYNGAQAHLYEINRMQVPHIDVAVAIVKGFECRVIEGYPCIRNGSLWTKFQPSVNEKTVASLIREMNIRYVECHDGMINTFRVEKNNKPRGGAIDRNLNMAVCKTVLASSLYNWRGYFPLPTEYLSSP